MLKNIETQTSNKQSYPITALRAERKTYLHQKITYMRLHEIVKKRADLIAQQNKLSFDYRKEFERLDTEITELSRLERICGNGLYLEKVLIGEKILECRGDIWANVDGRILAEAAMVDIANDCPHLKEKYFGNKRYDRFYQSSDHTYGYGPKHGGIKDEISIKSYCRHGNFTSEEKDACIYYLQNYKAIEATKTIKA